MVLITDLRESTDLRVRIGDGAFDALRREHDRLLGEAALAHGGDVVKGSGDGVIVLFGAAHEAIAAGVAMQQVIAQLNTRAADELGLAIGISAGARCTSTDGGTTRTGTGPASPVSVANLSLGKHYSCVASATNGVGAGAGSDPTPVVLVASPPGAPSGVKAVPGAATGATGILLVSFGAPASNGGTPITRYTANCSSSNGGVTESTVLLGATPSAITVAGVSTGKSYRCTVRAGNIVGTGTASSPSPVVIVGVPGAPSGLKVVRISAGQLRVTFTVGASHGSTLTRQTATCRSTNGGVGVTAVHTGATAVPIVVTGLTPGKIYVCTVFSTNARGPGLVSAGSSAVVA